jgi:hypothetical protein
VLLAWVPSELSRPGTITTIRQLIRHDEWVNDLCIKGRKRVSRNCNG